MIKISVIVPMRNEARYIEPCLNSLFRQTIAAELYEIIVVDGCSSDNSVAVIERLQSQHPNLTLLHNARRIMPAGMNLGIRMARGEIITVAGSHTTYPPDYLETSLRYLEETQADVVGGPITTVAADQRFVSRMCAAILSSRFGVGDAKFRTSLKEGFVDTVPFGSYRKAIFERCGYYNETLVRGQDRELNARIVSMGGKIYQTPALITEYYSVARFRELLSKAFNTGWWQPSIVQENAEAFSIRHLVPGAFVLILAGLGTASLVSPWAKWLVLSILLTYALSAMYFARSETTKTGLELRLAMPFFVLPFHACYGIGTLVGCLELFNPDRKTQTQIQTLPPSAPLLVPKRPAARISGIHRGFEESRGSSDPEGNGNCCSACEPPACRS